MAGCLRQTINGRVGVEALDQMELRMQDNHEQANFHIFTQGSERYSIVVRSVEAVENHGPIIPSLCGTDYQDESAVIILIADL
jgi:hypothetical protein